MVAHPKQGIRIPVMYFFFCETNDKSQLTGWCPGTCLKVFHGLSGQVANEPVFHSVQQILPRLHTRVTEIHVYSASDACYRRKGSRVQTSFMCSVLHQCSEGGVFSSSVSQAINKKCLCIWQQKINFTLSLHSKTMEIQFRVFLLLMQGSIITKHKTMVAYFPGLLPLRPCSLSMFMKTAFIWCWQQAE